ncbi:MAG TPA: RecX family transcriptional regulator [Vicinamibacterales bacterium]|nr:RecX family transcriptional regulator [Vicinamibacterales bacterium]
MALSAYQDAIAMLARRELSESQLRARLARRHHDASEIDAALARLREAGQIDDARTAGAIARRETNRRRGRLRVRQQLAAAGIAPLIAERALDDVFEQVDVEAMLEAALERKLAGRARIEDRREFARLYRHLTGQGFESERVLRALRSRQGSDQS